MEWIKINIKKDISRSSVSGILKDRQRLDHICNPMSMRASAADHPVLRHESMGFLTDDVVQMKGKLFAILMKLPAEFALKRMAAEVQEALPHSGLAQTG